MKRVCVWVTLLALMAVCIVPATRATASGGLTVSPPLKEIILSPGLIQTNFDVTLKNTTGVAVNATYKLVDLKALGQYGGNSLGQAGLPDAYGLAQWMTLASNDHQQIANGETATIRINIDNRQDLTPGGHYGAVVISANADSSQKSTINLNQQIVSLVFIKKLGGEVYGLQLDSLKPNKPNDIPDTVELQFRATGNVHVVPRGYVQVTDPNGKLLAKSIINEDSSIILPGASRKFIALLQPIATSRTAGRYTVTAFYHYDGENNYHERSASFNRAPSFPWTVIVGATVVLVLVSGFLYARNRRSRSRRR